MVNESDWELLPFYQDGSYFIKVCDLVRRETRRIQQAASEDSAWPSKDSVTMLLRYNGRKFLAQKTGSKPSQLASGITDYL